MRLVLVNGYVHSVEHRVSHPYELIEKFGRPRNFITINGPLSTAGRIEL